jgi:IS4 transposase
MKLSAELVWELYRKRGDAENRIKELEYDFGADNFCMQDFYATEAALRTVMVSYNLMALFKLTVIQSKVNERITTIRLKCFSIGSWVVK